MFKLIFFISIIFSYLNILSFTPLEAETKKTFFESGKEKILKKNYSDALNDFNKSIKLNPTNWSAFHNRGLSKEYLKDFKGAISDYTKAIELNPNPWETSYFRRAYTHAKIKNFSEAIIDYSQALEINPKNEDALFYRAFTKALIGDNQGAINDYSKLIAIAPNDFVALTNRGLSKAALEDNKGAISDYSKALDIDNKYENAYFHRGYANYEIEKFYEAIIDYSQALEINPKNEDAFFNRGLSKIKIKDYDGAIKDFSKVIELNPSNNLALSNIEEIEKKIDEKSEKALIDKGFSNLQSENYQESISDFTKAIEINPSNSYSFETRAYSRAKIGDFKGAINDLSEAIRLNPTSYPYMLRGYYKTEIGDVEGAASDYKKVFSIGNKKEILSAINYLSYSYISNGIYQEILPLINKGKEISKYIKEKNDDYLDLFYKEALYYGSIGDNYNAKESLKKCLIESEKIDLQNSFKTVECKKYLANLHIFFKEYKDAKKLFKFRSLEGQLIRSQIAFNQNNLPKAQKILQRLYDLQQKNNVKNPDFYLSELLGYAYWWDGKNKKAKIYHEQALNGYEEIFGEKSHYLIQPLLNVAMVYFNENNFEKTEYYLRRSLKIQFKYIQDQIPFLPISKRNQFLKNLGISYQAIFTASEIHPQGKDLALFARINRHGLLEEIEKKQITFANLEGPQKILMKKIKDLTNQISSTNISDGKLIEKMKINKEELEAKLYKSIPQLKSRVYDLSDISREIPKDSVLIEFQRYRPFIFDNPGQSLDEQTWEEAKYQVLLLFPDNNVESIDLGKAAVIDELISNAVISSEESLIDAQDLWEDLGKKIIKPIEKYIKNKKILYISPDSELNKIPFSAIGSFNDSVLLGDIFEIRLITTGRDLINLNNKGPSINKKSLVFANPSFDFIEDIKNSNEEIKNRSVFKDQKRSFDQERSLWSALPGTKKEAAAIAKITNAKLFLEKEASALNIQNATPPQILHIATHSFYIGDEQEENGFANVLFTTNTLISNKRIENPLLRSGIVLAGANNPKKNSNDDGYLTALEVSKLDWNGTELVVVSGCESGLGELKSGEGVYGLKRSIAVAGARSSLLSLWKVDDKATSDFMESFYLKLKNGEGRTSALSSTQKEFRNHPIKAWRHPNVWAAFQLSGDWRPIKW